MYQMTPSEARELLQLHSGRHEDIYHPKWEHGYIGCLRPFTGLRDENFHEVMMCLKVLAPEIENAAAYDQSLHAACWALCHLGRSSCVDQHSIPVYQAQRLDRWSDHISFAMFALLDGCGVEVAFEMYDKGPDAPQNAGPQI